MDYDLDDADFVEEEPDFSVDDALRILSLNSHRETTRWASVTKAVFINGREQETHSYIEPQYEKPPAVFEAEWRMTEFEAVAIAKAYIMAGIEEEVASVRAS